MLDALVAGVAGPSCPVIHCQAAATGPSDPAVAPSGVTATAPPAPANTDTANTDTATADATTSSRSGRDEREGQDTGRLRTRPNCPRRRDHHRAWCAPGQPPRQPRPNGASHTK